jgi:hypothetical protein
VAAKIGNDELEGRAPFAGPMDFEMQLYAVQLRDHLLPNICLMSARLQPMRPVIAEFYRIPTDGSLEEKTCKPALPP